MTQSMYYDFWRYDIRISIFQHFWIPVKLKFWPLKAHIVSITVSDKSVKPWRYQMRRWNIFFSTAPATADSLLNKLQRQQLQRQQRLHKITRTSADEVRWGQMINILVLIKLKQILTRLPSLEDCNCIEVFFNNLVNIWPYRNNRMNLFSSYMIKLQF